MLDILKMKSFPWELWLIISKFHTFQSQGNLLGNFHSFATLKLNRVQQRVTFVPDEQNHFFCHLHSQHNYTPTHWTPPPPPRFKYCTILSSKPPSPASSVQGPHRPCIRHKREKGESAEWRLAFGTGSKYPPSVASSMTRKQTRPFLNTTIRVIRVFLFAPMLRVFFFFPFLSCKICAVNQRFGGKHHSGGKSSGMVESSMTAGFGHHFATNARGAKWRELLSWWNFPWELRVQVTNRLFSLVLVKEIEYSSQLLTEILTLSNILSGGRRCPCADAGSGNSME